MRDCCILRVDLRGEITVEMSTVKRFTSRLVDMVIQVGDMEALVVVAFGVQVAEDAAHGVATIPVDAQADGFIMITITITIMTVTIDHPPTRRVRQSENTESLLVI